MSDLLGNTLKGVTGTVGGVTGMHLVTEERPSSYFNLQRKLDSATLPGQSPTCWTAVRAEARLRGTRPWERSPGKMVRNTSYRPFHRLAFVRRMISLNTCFRSNRRA